MSVLRDIIMVAGTVAVVGSIATQSLWIAGVVFGCLLIGASLSWSYAAQRAQQAEKARHKR